MTYGQRINLNFIEAWEMRHISAMKPFRRLLLHFGAAALMMSPASAVVVDVFAFGNSSSGGVPVATVPLTAGQTFTVSASPTDLWTAGDNPRWSNADGLIVDLFATG